MFKISKNKITLTRGDTFNAKIEIVDGSGNPYTPVTGDVIKFAVKRSVTDEDVLIEKTILSEPWTLHLDPEDTKNLEFGNYLYDMQITFANGDVYTFITKTTLTIAEEIG